MDAAVRLLSSVRRDSDLLPTVHSGAGGRHEEAHSAAV